jgi:hypothetical protein
MEREVKGELLDELPPSDPRAIWSRRDLRRINACMAQAHIMARLLRRSLGHRVPRTIVDLGGGDGTLLLQVARRMAPRWKSVRAFVVDRQSLVSPRTRDEFNALSWQAESLEANVLDWLERPNRESSDIIIASLFLHHFKPDILSKLLRGVALQSGFFVACEPRRAAFPLVGASLVGFIGCNSVTRHDAKVSVRAGFAGKELSALWPSGDGWQLRETGAGLFSHCFVAQRANEQVV